MNRSRFGKAFTALVVALALVNLSNHATAAFPPGADSFASAVNIPDTNAISNLFNIDSYSAESGEPSIGANLPFKSAWWKWTAPADGQLLLEAVPVPDILISPPAANPLIAVYEGNSFGSLTLRGQATTGFNPFLPFSSLLPRVSIPVKAGQLLRIKMDVVSSETVGFVGVSLRFFAVSARTYQGAITLGYNPGEQAAVTLSVTSAGTFTGKLSVPGKTIPFSGSVNTAFRLDLGIPDAPVDRPVTLSIDLANGTGPLPIAMYDGTNDSDGFLYPVSRFSPNPASISGNYTAVLDTGRNGYLVGRITPSGKGVFTGVTGDGTKLAIAGSLVDIGNGVYGLPFCQSLFRGKGFIAGGLRFVENATDIVDSTGFENRYKRPSSTGAFFPAGIQNSFAVAGRMYTKPQLGNRAAGFLDATNGTGILTVSTVSQEITGFVENLSLSTANKFSFTSSARKPVLILNPKTGIVSGTIQEPAGSKRKLVGILTGGAMPVLKGFVSGTTGTANFQVTIP